MLLPSQISSCFTFAWGFVMCHQILSSSVKIGRPVEVAMLCAHFAGHYMYPRLREGNEIGTNLSGLLHGQQLTAAGGGDQCLTFWYTMEGNVTLAWCMLLTCFWRREFLIPKRLYFFVVSCFLLNISFFCTGSTVLRLLNTEGGAQEELWRHESKYFSGWILGQASLNSSTNITVRLGASTTSCCAQTLEITVDWKTKEDE